MSLCLSPCCVQNGLTAGISSHLLKGRPVSWTKLAVLVRLAGVCLQWPSRAA